MKKTMVILCLILYSYGCSKRDHPESIPSSGNPIAATLIKPADNTVCQEGVVAGNKVRVTFKWRAGENTDSYSLKVKNLKTNVLITTPTTQSEVTVALEMGTAYSWFVTSMSKNSEKTVQSAVWKFYSIGKGQVSYAPFPADIIAPINGSTLAASEEVVTLSWEGDDVDGDIKGYDVYFDIINPPDKMIRSNFQGNTLDNIAIVPNTIYYWRVKTKDRTGNVSDSGVSMFKNPSKN